MSGPVWPGNSYAQSGRALVLTHFQTEHIDLHRFEQFLADPCNLSDLHFQHFCTYHQRLWTVKNCYLSTRLNLTRQTQKLRFSTKAELPLEGIIFRTQFPSLGIFINKKVGNRKN